MVHQVRIKCQIHATKRSWNFEFAATIFAAQFTLNSLQWGLANSIGCFRFCVWMWPGCRIQSCLPGSTIVGHETNAKHCIWNSLNFVCTYIYMYMYVHLFKYRKYIRKEGKQCSIQANEHFEKNMSTAAR